MLIAYTRLFKDRAAFTFALSAREVHGEFFDRTRKSVRLMREPLTKENNERLQEVYETLENNNLGKEADLLVEACVQTGIWKRSIDGSEVWF